MAATACSLSQAQTRQQDALATRVAATLTAVSADQTPSSTHRPTARPSRTPAPTTTATSTNQPMPSPPADGISLNCDGTYQRVRLIDQVDGGRKLMVDQWTDNGWQTDWEYRGGDPTIRQLTDRAGAYSFGGCQRLLVAPRLYSGSGAVLEIHIFEWTGQDVTEVYSNDGIHGDWQVTGDRIRFENSLYLFDEPNCCPCNRQVTEHQWNGSAFIEVETEIRPTYTGTPPPICQL